MTEPANETRVINIKGRDIEVQLLKDMQLMFIAREARKLQRLDGDQDSNRTAIMSAGRVLDVLESAIVKEADKEFLIDLMVTGELQFKDMTAVFTAFGDDKEEAPKPRVRRGRPPSRKA